MTDLILFQSGSERFAWGANLDRAAEARTRYIAALQAADRQDYRALFELLGVPKLEQGSAVKATR